MKVIEYLRGITEDECRRLRSLDIVHTIDLMHAASYEVDRAKVARKSGIPEPRLLDLAHQAALIEVSGLDARRLQVLRRLGIVSLRILREEDAEDLHRRLIRALGMGSPSLGDVQYWISQARTIDVIEEEGGPVQELSPSLLTRGTPG